MRSRSQKNKEQARESRSPSLHAIVAILVPVLESFKSVVIQGLTKAGPAASRRSIRKTSTFRKSFSPPSGLWVIMPPTNMKLKRPIPGTKFLLGTEKSC
jgi:hypothetical protein